MTIRPPLAGCVGPFLSCPEAINRCGLFYNDSMELEAHSILAIDAAPFGRSLDLVPSINAIRSSYQTAHIAVAASNGICELLASLRLIDKAIGLGAIKPSDRGFGHGLLRLMRLSKSAGSDEIDLVLDFSPGTASLLFGLTRRARILTPTMRRQRWTTGRAGTTSKKTPGSDSYTSILSQLGLNSDISNWTHPGMAHESSRFEESLERSGFKGGEPILLLYTMEAGWSRSWPIHCYAELAVRLSSNYGVRVVAADVPFTNDFTNSISLALPKESIKLRSPRAAELVAAVARSSLVVTDDSGVARMANGLGTPAIDLAAGSSAGNRSSSLRSRDTEAVYQEACHLLQASRTGALFRD